MDLVHTVFQSGFCLVQSLHNCDGKSVENDMFCILIHVVLIGPVGPQAQVVSYPLSTIVDLLLVIEVDDHLH